ncbi:hypothetical protein HPP92_012912 [Vanilla planifolia]|uniref:Uncharacterized protein n=1 Tax=Vanilla planifolia TaxID=51239 RepID=A0A835UYA9_VANPL|nr:hypothetical protein HPP92_012912 [Vanilla planifolia]
MFSSDCCSSECCNAQPESSLQHVACSEPTSHNCSFFPFALNHTALAAMNPSASFLAPRTRIWGIGAGMSGSMMFGAYDPGNILVYHMLHRTGATFIINFKSTSLFGGFPR